MKVSTRLL